MIKKPHRTLFYNLLKKFRNSQSTNEIYGITHSIGDFLDLVRHPKTKEYLAPTYEGLLNHIINGQKRLITIKKNNSSLISSTTFKPFPGDSNIIKPSNYKSRKVAIIDSGVLQDHPLIRNNIIETIDFVGEGIEDLCGHGTIEAIIQIWFEPQVELIILKAFSGKEGNLRINAVIDAFEYLIDSDVSHIFMAGGIDTKKYPSCKIICQLADALMDELGRDRTVFIATNGNIGSEGNWCPANAKSVKALGVKDMYSIENPLHDQKYKADIYVLQKGNHASFPQISPLTLNEFYSQSVIIFNQRKEYKIACKYVELAGLENINYSACIAYIKSLVFLKKYELALYCISFYLTLYESSALLLGQKANIFFIQKNIREARKEYLKAIHLSPDDPSILLPYGKLLEENFYRYKEALEVYIKTCRIDLSQIKVLHEFGWNLYYKYKNWDLVIATNRELINLDSTFILSYYNISLAFAQKGDFINVIKYLALYAENKKGFDSSHIQYSEKIVQEIIVSKDKIGLERLSYGYLPERKYSYEYTAINKMFNEDNDWVEFFTTWEDWDKMIRAEIEYSNLLLLKTWNANHEKILKLLLSQVRLEFLLDMPMYNKKIQRLVIKIKEQIAKLYLRKREVSSTITYFNECLDYWKGKNVRIVEDILLEKGFAYISIGDYANAKDCIKAAEETVLTIHPDYNTFNIKYNLGKLFFCIEEGDFDSAVTHLNSAIGLEKDNIIIHILALKLAIKANDAFMIRDTEMRLKKMSFKDLSSYHFTLRLLEDYPPLNFILPNGKYIKKYLVSSFHYKTYFDIELASFFDTGFSFDHIPCNFFSNITSLSATDDKTRYIAFIGTGINKILALKEYTILDINYTKESSEDQHGATTLLCLNFFKFLEKSQNIDPKKLVILNLKVLNKQGLGYINDFINIIGSISTLDLPLVFIPVQTNTINYHLLGLIHRIKNQGSIIITNKHEEEKEYFFPSRVRDIIYEI